MTANDTTIDDAEIEKFHAMAEEWWNPHGKFRPLHKFNPVRIEYIRDKIAQHFARDIKTTKPFSGLRILDIGCGGGLLSEPMARLGAHVLGADAGAANIEVAKIHAKQSGLEIDYQTTTAENLHESGETFDVILNMEVVEHVANAQLFIDACSQMVRPNGLMFVATINRTFKAKALAIFMAENVLRWLPKGTHEFEKLVKPEEIEMAITRNGLEMLDQCGVFYNPFIDQWKRSRDMDVNYMVLAGRPAH